jgi:hydrogenase maturation protease
MSILVLGVGNILLSDEGIGVRVVEELERRYQFSDNVEVVDGGTAGMELLGTVASRDHVIIVDAVKTGDPAGTSVVLRNKNVPAFFREKISPHQLGISDLLAALSLTDEQPKGLSLIGMVPVSLATSIDLSPEIQAKVDEMLELVVAELALVGETAKPIAKAS